MEPVADSFSKIDWMVVILYLAATTWIGHRLRGRQAGLHDFFRAGRSLPWPAVAGSIIATEISALTFIGVPAMVFAVGGDFTYLQWALGSVAARAMVAWLLVPRYYHSEIYSPYDYMGHRLGVSVKRLTTGLFFLGAVLGQSVRVLVTALILRTVTGMDFTHCIGWIALFAVGWTLMGGMATVIWTDVVQFFLFVGGGLAALVWMVWALPGGVSEWLAVAGAEGKFRVWNLSTDPAVGFTLWVGILAMPFQNLAAFGTDQLNAQRMLCCRSVGDARRAIVWSSVSQGITLLMLAVGSALFCYYQAYPPVGEVLALFQSNGDTVFPVWITTVLPVGLSGLVLAGAFAAAISSLDSLLTALSQTTLSLFRSSEQESGRSMRWSRLLVVIWGLILALFAMGLELVRGDINLVNLAFGMVTYTYGPMLGILILALLPMRVRWVALCVGVLLSICLVLWIRPDLEALFRAAGWWMQEESWKRPALHYAWLYPLTTAVTVLAGLLGSQEAAAFLKRSFTQCKTLLADWHRSHWS
ncbi:MAG: hypothetical protein ACFCUX_06695 [Candidatus Methylacidiphilales bacterium]